MTITTELGNIVIGVQADLSPIAAGNFVALASCGFYDGSPFHRAATLQDGTPFVIQGGASPRTPTGEPGYTIKDEPVTATYGRGTVAMARSAAPDSVSSQFFIVLDDGARSILASYNTYQIIGTVTSGMETADAIYAAAGGVELPADPVVMTSVTVDDAVGSGSSEPIASPSSMLSAACDEGFTFAEEQARDPMTDSVSDYDDAVKSCSTLEEWLAGAAAHGGAIAEGVDPIVLLQNRCREAYLASTTLCRSIGTS